MSICCICQFLLTLLGTRSTALQPLSVQLGSALFPVCIFCSVCELTWFTYCLIVFLFYFPSCVSVVNVKDNHIKLPIIIKLFSYEKIEQYTTTQDLFNISTYLQLSRKKLTHFNYNLLKFRINWEAPFRMVNYKSYYFLSNLIETFWFLI